MYAAVVNLVDRRTPSGMFQMGRLIVGPAHLVAGYTERFGSPLFGDIVTACGLTLPNGEVRASTEVHWIASPSKCGDCFRLDIPCDYCGALAGEPCNFDCLSTEENR